MSKISKIAKLANRIMEEGLAYDMSEAFRYAHAGESERFFFSLDEKGRFFYDEK